MYNFELNNFFQKKYIYILKTTFCRILYNYFKSCVCILHFYIYILFFREYKNINI